MNTTRLGDQYKDDLFVGTVLDGGVIYDLDLTHTRKTLSLTGPLADGVADNATGSLLAEQSSDRFWKRVRHGHGYPGGTGRDVCTVADGWGYFSDHD